MSVSSYKQISQSPECESLSLGETARLTHQGCSSSGTSKNLAVTRNKNGLVYICYKCGDSGICRSAAPAVSRVNKTKPKGIYKIPSGATGNTKAWRRPIAEWIHQYLMDSEVLDHGLVAHEWNLYVPISGDCFLMRCFDPDWTGPKWVKRGTISDYRVQPGTGATFPIVVVEDCISAICVARYMSAVALMCTSISDSTLAWIAKSGHTSAMVWLDDDNSQVRKAQNKIKARLQLVLPRVEIIRAGTDPKNVDPLWLRTVLL